MIKRTKRGLTAILTGILSIALLAGCASGGELPPGTAFSGTPATAGRSVSEDIPPAAPDAPAADAIVDLTSLSATMVYSEVYHMMMSPNDYVGKTIKMAGIYRASHDPENDIYYHFVVIADATACCEQGLEFILNDAAAPDDYPAEQVFVEVTGVWKSGQENGGIYYYIDADEMLVI